MLRLLIILVQLAADSARWCGLLLRSPRSIEVENLFVDADGRSDVTEFLDNEITRAPVTLYLFHVIRQLLDGRRFVCWGAARKPTMRHWSTLKLVPRLSRTLCHWLIIPGR